MQRSPTAFAVTEYVSTFGERAGQIFLAVKTGGRFSGKSPFVTRSSGLMVMAKDAPDAARVRATLNLAMKLLA